MARYPIPGKAHAIQADIALTVGGLGAVVQHKAGKLTARARWRTIRSSSWAGRAPTGS